MSRARPRGRVVVAGLGDTGVLVARRLRAAGLDVVGVSAVPGLVSGQELGLRLARPETWQRHYRLAHGRFRGLDGVRLRHAGLAGLDLTTREVVLDPHDGGGPRERFDLLVVATGVRNGFWRDPTPRSLAEVDDALAAAHRRLREATSVVVVGGGAAAVSSAAQIATALPHLRVDLYHPGERGLPQHHPRVWDDVRTRLERAGVGVHPGHRAMLPDDAALGRLGPATVAWSTGQAAVAADVVLWTVGRVRPNTGWLPADLLDDAGFVRVSPTLAVPGVDGVFAIGDVAATDPLRSSARNRADGLLARNVVAHLQGRPGRAYEPPGRRWGSVLGPMPDGLVVYGPGGRGFRFPAWTVDVPLQDWIVKGGIYGGVRRG